VKTAPLPVAATSTTLQNVVDRIAGDPTLTDGRKRDLRSAVITLGKLNGQPLGQIPLDLAEIRRILDATVPAQIGISAKRFANLRSDLSAAIAASGLHPILKTAGLDLDSAWFAILEPIEDAGIRNGLSRFARWASLRRIAPTEVDIKVVERFVADLKASTLVRNLSGAKSQVFRSWNALAKHEGSAELGIVPLRTSKPVPRRLVWEILPASFREDVAAHLTWASVPDPLDERARARALSPGTLRLRKNHIHSAVTAAVAAELEVARVTSLAGLVEPGTFRGILRQRWKDDGGKLSAFTDGVAGALIAIASEWVKVPADVLKELKSLRRKLGTLPAGLTEKNRTLLRKFEDPRLLSGLLELPDKVWRTARRELATSRRPFIDLQSALAIELLLNVPLRMQNLAALRFDEHLHWPQGRGKPALMIFGSDETKNRLRLEFEISAQLAERLRVYRDEIAPKVTGRRPDAVFVTWAGEPRGQNAITIAIRRTVLRNLGIKLSPHQFRHITAKIVLDANPGAYELVRQLLGHKNFKTTTNFYAGIDTRRAGRAHAELLMKLRERRTVRGSRKARKPAEE
jgi:integrase